MNIQGLLLEGCVWDEKKEVLYFIDIEGRKVYQYNPKNEAIHSVLVHTWIGCVVLDPEGNLIGALQDGLYRINFEQQTVVKIMHSQLGSHLRYNDGKCDPLGNLWVGSMCISQENDKAYQAGSLYCIRKQQVIRTYPGYTIPNGLVWKKRFETPTIFYHIDTPTKRVMAYEIAGDTELGQSYIAVDLSKEKSAPDGMCIDVEGNLWIAMWGGSKVLCCNPTTGEILQKIDVPDLNVSCCIFGGKELDTLYITTARDTEGKGGELYAVKTNSKGERVYRYGS